MNNKEAIKNIKTKAKESLKSLKGNKTALRILGITGIALTGVAADAGCVNIGANNAINDETRPVATTTDSNFAKLGIKRLDVGIVTPSNVIPQAPYAPYTKSETTIYATPSSTEIKDGQAIYFSAGEVKNVPAGTVLSGDIEANEQVLYDNDEHTALVVKLPNGGNVRAQWGASGLINIPNNILDQKAEEIAQGIRSTRSGVSVQIKTFDGQNVNPQQPWTHEGPVNNQNYPINEVGSGGTYYLKNDRVSIVVGDTKVISRDDGILVEKNDGNALTGQIVISKRGDVKIEAPWGATVIELPYNLTYDQIRNYANQKWLEMVHSGKRPIMVQINEGSVTIGAIRNGKYDYYWPNVDPQPNTYYFPYNPAKW